MRAACGILQLVGIESAMLARDADGIARQGCRQFAAIHQSAAGNADVTM
jgi:hypothetical protein